MNNYREVVDLRFWVKYTFSFFIVQTEEPVHGTSPQASRTSTPQVCLSQQQIQTLHVLQQSAHQGQQLTTSQQQLLASLQHQYRY